MLGEVAQVAKSFTTYIIVIRLLGSVNLLMMTEGG